MLKPLEVLKLYPEHDYTLCGAYDSRIAAACDRPFVVFQGKAWSRAEFRQALLATARVLTETQECFRNEFSIPNLITGFGMTEIPGLTCNPFEGPQKPASLGPIGRHPGVPRFVALLDELPHTPTHKIAKHVLKADPTLKSRAIDLQAKR